MGVAARSGLMISGWARFPTQGVGFCAEAVIMVVRPAFGGAARREGQACAAREAGPEGSQRLAGQGSRSDRGSDAERP
jgi:hypothetical protein